MKNAISLQKVTSSFCCTSFNFNDFPKKKCNDILTHLTGSLSMILSLKHYHLGNDITFSRYTADVWPD